MQILKSISGNEIKVFAQTVENEALEQIKNLSNFEAYTDSKIRIMPDCHAGAGCTIGTTMTIKDKVTPNLVGVDIGCGMLTIKLKNTEIDLADLDEVINKYIPNGHKVHSESQAKFDFSDLRCKREVNLIRASKAIGSLGGGNHFIEVGKNSKDEL
ncbi:MAG: RtcB family protein, partial [Bacteroidota bacterium]